MVKYCSLICLSLLYFVISCTPSDINDARLDVGFFEPKIIAHCGFWNVEGAAENSLSSLKNAGELGVYASEFDVQLTSDDSLIICHDTIINNLSIHEQTLAGIRQADIRLRNGESIPTLESYLKESLKYPNLHLVLELKSYGNESYEDRAINACVKKLNKFSSVLDRMIFMSFSKRACIQLKEKYPNNNVFYLDRDLSPKDLYKLGIDGINCHYSHYMAHPNWIYDSISLGLRVGAWTVDKEEDVKELIDKGVEFIATNNPKMAMECASAFSIHTEYGN